MLTYPIRRYFTNSCFGPVPGSLPHMLLNGVLLKYHHGKHPTIFCRCMHYCDCIPRSDAFRPRHLHFLWTLRMNLRIRRCYGIRNTSEGGAYTRNPSLMLTRYPVDGSVLHFMVQKVSVSRR